jgi:phytanoyl-CoA hydroxylase
MPRRVSQFAHSKEYPMELVEQYQENGYVIVPDLIPHAKIDLLVDRVERFKRGRRPYWSESIHKWILPELDDHGFMIESMEQFTRLWLSGGLAQAGNNVVLSAEINDVLRQLKPGHNEFIHWLNHLFYRSTGSVDHIDNWYLDTDPAGELVGAWVALEDIHPDSGAFRVFPKSHKLPGLAQLWSLDHVSFIKHCAGLAAKLEPLPIIIKKGTVVFFHPFILHGAVDQRDPRYSRRSVTAHYIPYGSLKKERYQQKDPPPVRLAREMKKARKLKDYPIAVSHSWRDEAQFNFGGLTSYAKSLVFGRTPIEMDMKRRAWVDQGNG